MFKAYYLANRAIFPKKTIGPWQNWRITKGEYIKEVEKSIDIAAPRLGLIKSDLSELGPESLKNTYGNADQFSLSTSFDIMMAPLRTDQDPP